MADAGFNFEQRLFLAEFQNLRTFLLHEHPFNFYHDYLHSYGFQRKLKTLSKFKMADPRRRIVTDHFLIINDVIVTSLLLLKIINVLTNFMIVSDTILFKYFLL